ncbi:MAG: GAF domain-containing protein [Symploca sp. SIO3E6]|nr:GAF domain-containing protein [Caldora sp. SIO3E6]
MKSLLHSEQAVTHNKSCETQSGDTTSEESLNDLVRIAAHICGTPVALISFVEDNHMWFKTQVGLDATEMKSVLELCTVALPQDEAIVISDIRIDERFSNSSVVTSHPYIRFYAGLPLMISSGQVLGSLCVMDHIPRELSQKQMKMLSALSDQVINQLEQQQNLYTLTYTIYEDQQTQQKLQESQTRLKLLNSISTQITAGMSVYQVIEHTVKQISEHFKSFRVVYSTIDEQKITVLYSLQPPTMPPLDKIIPIMSGLPKYFDPLRSFQPVVTEDLIKALGFEPFVDKLLSFGIKAMVNVPLHHSDKLVGLLCLDSPKPRQWSEHEVGTLTQVAEYLSFALKEAHAQEQRFQAEAALRQQHQRERLLSKITQQIRRSLDLGKILDTTVTEVRHFFQAERVMAHCYQQNRDGIAIAQSAQPSWISSLDVRMDRSWFEKGAKLYQQGNVYVIDDIEQVKLPFEFQQFLAQQQVQAALIVPILETEQLLGIIAIYQCSQTRNWKTWEMDLLEQLATQVAIAIQQGKLYQQVQQLNSELKHKVQQRTAQLEQALDLEATLKRITDQVRDSLDENQILQTAVEQLALALGVDCCQASVQTNEPGGSSICYEYRISSTSESQLKSSAKFSQVDYQQPHEQYFPCFLLTSAQVQAKEVILAYPIVDEQGVLGELRLVLPLSRSFNDVEIRLVRQVANQCAIALRQARLYQAAQQQAEALEKLNHLKDDFLSTVSHELRSPMTNIKMALKMLEMNLEPLDLGNAKEKIQRYLQILQDESVRELILINNLLDLSRLEAESEPLELSTIKLQDWLPEIIEPFVTRVHNQQQLLELELPTQLPPLNSDQHALERILGELLNNAFKYTPAGEQITVSAQATEKMMQLQVSNSGVEIATEELSQIFEKFYRIPNHDPWKHGGTGLGLALVKKLVEHLGGSIQAESSAAQTIFTVQLPLTQNCYSESCKGKVEEFV